MIGRSVASAMRLKCASAISGDWPSVNGAGGNTSSAEAPPSAAMRAIRAASRLPSAQMPLTMRQPVADLVLGDIEHAPLLIEGAGGDFGRMRVDGDRGKPSTAATSRRWLRKLFSSIERSSWNGSSTAGMTPWGTK